MNSNNFLTITIIKIITGNRIDIVPLLFTAKSPNKQTTWIKVNKCTIFKSTFLKYLVSGWCLTGVIQSINRSVMLTVNHWDRWWNHEIPRIGGVVRKLRKVQDRWEIIWGFRKGIYSKMKCAPKKCYDSNTPKLRNLHNSVKGVTRKILLTFIV